MPTYTPTAQDGQDLYFDVVHLMVGLVNRALHVCPSPKGYDCGDDACPSILLLDTAIELGKTLGWTQADRDALWDEFVESHGGAGTVFVAAPLWPLAVERRKANALIASIGEGR